MNTQKNEALEVAKELEYCLAKWGKQDSITFHAYDAVKTIRAQQKRIAELEEINTQLCEQADVAANAYADLQAQLVKEAARTAEEKLRADQISKQHDMQAKMHQEAARKLAAHPAAAQGVDAWISVKDQLPEIREWREGSIAGISDLVLTCNEFDSDSLRAQYLRKGGCGDLTTLHWEDSPTHWMKAPALAAQAKQGG
jgi:hypothetical protein